MKKIVLSFILLWGASFAQVDYVAEYNQLDSLYDGDDLINAHIEFFNQLTDTEKLEAVSAISILGGVEFMSYELYPYIQHIYGDESFTENILERLADNDTPFGYRVVSIQDLYNRNLQSSNLATMNNILKAISIDEQVDMVVREYALAKYSGNPTEETYMFIEQMLESNESFLVRGAIRCLAKYVKSPDLADEKARWFVPLAQVVNQHLNDISQATGSIMLLGEIQTDESNQFLLDLFSTFVKDGLGEITIIATALMKQPSPQVFSYLISEIEKYRGLFIDPYQLDLCIGRIAKQNSSIVKTLSNGETNNEKITYLKAIETLRTQRDFNTKSIISDLLNDDDPNIRYRTIKTARIIFSATEEEALLRPLLDSETEAKNIALIMRYIGRE
ncbi:MAG: hypothetical protein U9Q77_06610 [Candidatus Marinimicrobia bacterium]|nr:hypothetical protein [Candidatus Neomarinimicrobiota bacterium]